MFDFLSQKFSTIFRTLTGTQRLTEKNIDETLLNVHDALLQADVPYNVVQAFTEKIKVAVVGQKILASLKPSEQLAKVVHEQITEFLGGKATQTVFAPHIPSVLMLMGLQGSGKTTTAGKLALLLKKEAEKRGKKRKILCASVDFYRPAAIDQLEIVAKQVGVDFYRASATSVMPAVREICNNMKQEAYDHLLLDTAGRLHVDNVLLQELQDIDAHVQPAHKLLIVDAMTGQESLRVAQAFEQAVGFQGVIMTKCDSETRAGAAFAFKYELKKPIFFIGVGEKAEDLEPFRAERMADRILGMGDLMSLVEKAQEKIKTDEQVRLEKSYKSGKMSLQDFADQLDMVSRLGSFGSVLKQMPTFGAMQMNDSVVQQGERQMKQFRAIISSMTPKERHEVSLLNASRKERIAQGAGVKVGDIDLLLQRFEQIQQYAKLFKKMGKFPFV